MALSFVWNLKNRWPLSVFKLDDLKISNELVRKLTIPEQTKQFVFAFRDPKTQSVVYVLSAQNLSERSVLDAECLIREVRPDAVVAQVSHLAVPEILSEESDLRDGVNDPVPTSSFRVLRRCFLDKINKEKYENVAGNLVLREIFGTSFYGHFLAAKRAAKDVGSSFLMLESPAAKNFVEDNPSDEPEDGNKLQGLVKSLVPQKACSLVSSSSYRFFLTNDVQSQMVKLLSSYMNVSLPKLSPLNSLSDTGSKEVEPVSSYEAPPFAKSIYPLLLDLYTIFIDLPSIGKALAHAQKMLFNVNKGEAVDTRIISEVYTFRIAVEGLRIALNNAGRLPIRRAGNTNLGNNEFSELPVDEKSHALTALALKSQTKKFKTVVAIVDASGLAGVRKHWNTAVPAEVEDLVGELLTKCEGDGEVSDRIDKKGILSKKPVVAVGAGATAVLGASSLSKVIPASTLMKVVPFKVPTSLNFILSQTQKVIAIALSKVLGPSKVVAPGLASSGMKMTAALKATASAEKIRAVTHSVIASAEKTSFSAMRTAFYQIMRSRRIRPVGFLPWATFGCSVATCTGLLVYGDGIECVAESFPAAPSIASLGRGIQSLHQASQEAKQMDSNRIQKSIESLMYRLKKVKVQ